ncbi:collagen alpha-2(I) chain-like isoform X1 [Equus przewalskii]|uniref:Collagen alpha-2(I) chain-like isoform X1 n=1 Tax=Equus przewalskii TaxID=9798 RepID=A0ABM4Q5I3_EQUPR
MRPPPGRGETLLMNNSLPPHGLCGHPSSLSALHEYAKKGRAGAKRPLAGPAPSAPGGAGVPGPLAFRLPAAHLCRRVSRPSEGSPRAPGPEGPPRSSRRREGRRGAGLDEDPNGLQLGAPGLHSGYVEDSLPAEVFTEVSKDLLLFGARVADETNFLGHSVN